MTTLRPTLLDVLTTQPQPLAALCAHTGLSVDELAAQVQQARACGVPLLVTAAGYALEGGTPAPGLVRRGAGQVVGRQLRYVAHTDSTQSEVRRYAQQLSVAGLSAHGAVVVAQQQGQGRGRRGRQWHSGAGSLLFSVLLEASPSLLQSLPTLPLACGVALQAACRAPWHLKWPNDLLSPTGHKAAGILVEAQWQRGELAQVVIGIGVNVTAEAVAQARAQGLTPAYLQEYTPISRAKLLERLLQRLDFWIQQPDEQVVAAWQAGSQMVGQRVSVKAAAGVLEGVALGLNAAGELLLDVGGSVQTITAGDVALIGNIS